MVSSLAVEIDLECIRRNVERIARSTGVDVLAVVKADAYGLGAPRVAAAIADLVQGFCVFSLREAQAAQLWEVGTKRILALGPPGNAEAKEFVAAHVQPAVSSVDQATRLRSAVPILSVDTGMQRFGCPPEEVDAVLKAGSCTEAFTHATRIEQVRALVDLLGGRGLKLHAAGSALLDEPAARLDAVRPGIALYDSAVRISARLVEVRDTRGPAGYSGFRSPRHGVILAGYSHGLRQGPCLINGTRRTILELGMQSAFVEAGRGDAIGDEVVLLGNGLDAAEVAADWHAPPHEVLVNLTRTAERQYLE